MAFLCGKWIYMIEIITKQLDFMGVGFDGFFLGIIWFPFFTEKNE
jgi:hypothetical protein